MVLEIYAETLSLRTLKIMPRNLNEIRRSWIRLQFTTVLYVKELALHPLLEQSHVKINDETWLVES